MENDKNAEKTQKKVVGRPFKKGNKYGKGRPPKVRCIPDILRKIGEEEGAVNGETKLEVIMRKVYKYALDGKAWAVQFIADRTEGKALERIEIAEEKTPWEIMNEIIQQGEKRRRDEATDNSDGGDVPADSSSVDNAAGKSGDD